MGATTERRTYELAVVMPVYNEQDCIASVVQSWYNLLLESGIDFLMITIDDGSRDATGQALEGIANDRIRVIHQTNRGHGPTILSGYREATRLAQWVFQCDSDDEMPPEAFPPLWQARRQYEAVFGYRQARRQSMGRKFISLCSRATVRLAFGKGVRDVNTPYRLMRSDVLRPIVDRIPPDMFAPNVIISGALARGAADRQSPRAAPAPANRRRLHREMEAVEGRLSLLRPGGVLSPAFRCRRDQRTTTIGRPCTERLMSPQTDSLPLACRALVFVLFLLFGACLVNLNGGDWDGVQIVLGSLFPAEAARGYTVLYRPGWQPLTYGILRFVYAITHSVEACMFLPAVFGAVGLTFFLGALRKITSGRLHVLLLVGIVLLIPELLFGAIYMNSTVFGFAFAAAALRFAADDWVTPRPANARYGRQFLAGGLLALACLCRFDFLLAYPMFLFLLLRDRPSSPSGPSLALAVGSVAICVPAWIGGMINPGALVNTVTTHQAGAIQGGWFSYPPTVRALLLVIGANLLVWITAGAGLLYALRSSLRQRRWFDLLGLPALVSLLYPVTSLNTPKYLVPFYMFLGLFAAWTLARLAAGERLPASLLPGVMILGVLLACFLPIHPSRSRDAMVRLTTETWRGTDDGPRSFWGYLFALRELSHQRPSLQWLEPLLAEPDDLVLVTPFDGWIANSSVSQPVVFHLVSLARNVELGPDSLWARIGDRKVLLTEPGALNANLACRFAQAQRPVRQSTIPLLDLSRDEIGVLRSLVQGLTSEAALVARTNTGPEAVHEALRSLVRRNLIEPSDPGNYQLKYHLHQLRFYPDPTGSVDTPDPACEGAGPSLRAACSAT